MSYKSFRINNIDNKYNNINGYKFLDNPIKTWNMIDYQDDYYNISKNSSDHSVDNIYEDNFLDLNDDINNINNYNFDLSPEINSNNIQFSEVNNYYENINKLNQPKISNLNENEKLKISNNVLKKTNTDLRNENKILEIELSRNENQSKKLLKVNSIFSKFDRNLQTFIYNLKKNLKNTTENNLEMTDLILSTGEKVNKIRQENEQIYTIYGDKVLSIEDLNKKYARIEILNKQNEKNIIIFQEKYFELNQFLEKQKLILDFLKSKENDLKLLKDSFQKRKKDNDELKNGLKSTINSLNGFNKNIPTENLQTDENNLYSKDFEIKKLNDSIIKIEEDIKRISEINEKMKNQINNNFDNKSDLLLKEKENENQLENYINENNILKKEIEEKENIINDLKKKIEIIEESLKKGETDLSKLNINLDEILKEKEEKLSNDENNQNEISLQMKNALEENIKIDNEINELTNKYENLLQNKDDEISKLQVQLGEVPINSYHSIQGLEDINFSNLDFESNRLINDIDIDILNNIENDENQKKINNDNIITNNDLNQDLEKNQQNENNIVNKINKNNEN